MVDLLEISFYYKNQFNSIHFHVIDSDSMLQVVLESLHFVSKSALD